MIESIGDFVKRSYVSAFPVLNKRAIPEYSDGLKLGQRRIIEALLELGGDKEDIIVDQITGYVIGKLIESGKTSQEEALGLLKRKGVLIGDGNFGAKYLYNQDITQSAGRYISCRLHPSYSTFINSVIKDCPTEISDYGYKCIKKYIVPIPIAAITGSKGIGLAANTNIPSFTAKSLLKALKTDDYHYLKSGYGMEIIPEKSTLRKIWEQGHGKITYKFEVEKGEYKGLKGAYIKGNAELCKPKLWIFNKKRREGLVFIEDLGDRVFVGKQYGVRKVDQDWIYQKLLSISEYTDVYMITLIKDGSVIRTSLRGWLSETYAEYIKSLESNILSRIHLLERDIIIYANIKSVGKLLLKNVPDEEIRKELGIHQWVIDEVSKKSISSLRKDYQNRIKNLKQDIKDLKSTNPVTQTDNLIILPQRIDKFKTKG